jgi:hypothetical protein
MDPKDFKKIPIADVTKVPDQSGTYDIIVDSWWCVTEDDCILIYKGFSRQCNSDKAIAEHFIPMEGHPATKVVQLKAAFFPHSCEFYQ